MKGSRDRTLLLVLACLAAFSLALLAPGHRDPLVRAVPYLFLLACPLMHLVHRGHRNHSAGERRTLS